MRARQELPHGTVAFLFTDIEGSTELWERERETMRAVVARHIALLDAAIADHGGVHFKTVGDAVQAAFHTAPAALQAAVAGQRTLMDEPWPAEIGSLRVRMALHAGVAWPDAGDYLAPSLNRLARMVGAGYGEQILCSEVVRNLAAEEVAPAISLRSLGPHRLRGLQEPEVIYQVLADGLPGHFPPLRSLPHHATNLTPPPTPLIDREVELALATRLLREQTARLVTLTGTGGSGKTRLAVEAAAELLDVFPDGVFFVDLAGVRDARLVQGVVAETLGVREVDGQDLDASVAAFLGLKRMLLVLDNFEQVIDAAPVLSQWLARAPALALLVTSRVPLRVRGERVVTVEPFAVPDDVSGLDLEEIARIPAVALLIERARERDADVALTADNAPIIVAICRSLDGLPLAIELAAARLRSFPPHVLLQRLERRLPVLAGGARDLPPRQRTLRDTIAWSHDLLDDEQKTLFRRLAVFAGGATLDSILAVANPEGDLDVMYGVEALVEQHLLRLDQRRGEPRYTLLETLREFGIEQLAASGEEERIREGHAAHLLAMLEEETASYQPGTDLGEEWLSRIDHEHDNLRSALSWRMEQGDPAAALRLVTAAGGYWSQTHRWSEGRYFLEKALDLASEGDPTHLAQAVSFAGSFAFAQGDNRSAIALLTQGLTIPESPETRPWLLRIVLNLAQAHGQLREFAKAMRHYERALSLATDLEDRRSVLEVRWSMAYTATSQGALERARELAEAILTDARTIGDPLVVAGTKELLAWIALAANDLGRASELLADARPLAEQAPHWAEGLRSNLLIDEAILAYRQGNHAGSVSKAMVLLDWARTVNAQQEMLLALLLLASNAVQFGQMAEAARWFGALAAGLVRGDHWLHQEPAVRSWHEADIARARASLGSATFDRLWREGQVISLEAALAEAERVACPVVGGQQPLSAADGCGQTGAARACPALSDDPGSENARVVGSVQLREEVIR